MRVLQLLLHGPVLIAPYALARLGMRGQPHLKMTTTTNKSWSAPVKVNVTVRAVNANAFRDLMVRAAAALRAQVTAMVMVFAKVLRSLQKTTSHLTYMKILPLNMTVPGMPSTVTVASVTMAFVAQTAV